MTPLVSILIPAFNAGPWIADTISSALAQTWPRTEIIVVDDGSSDWTLSIADQFSSKNVFVTFQKNQGAASARNKAFSHAQGDYIQWLDADDLLAPDKISRQMEAVQQISNPRALLSSEWGQFMFRTSRAKFIPTPLWENLAPAEWLLRKMERNLFMHPSSWLVSRELTEAAGPWDTRLSLDDDGEYFCRVVLAGEKIHFIPGAKTFYRISGFRSLSRVDQSDKKLESLWLSMRLHIHHLRTLEDSPRARAACVTYLKNWLDNFFPARPDIIAEAQKLAATLGGNLDSPQLRPKYAWMEKILGRNAASRAQIFAPQLKTHFQRIFDRALWKLENLTRV